MTPGDDSYLKVGTVTRILDNGEVEVKLGMLSGTYTFGSDELEFVGRKFGGDTDGRSSATETLTSAANGDLRASTQPLRFGRMRDLETIDSELRLLVAVRRVCRESDGSAVHAAGGRAAGRTPRADRAMRFRQSVLCQAPQSFVKNAASPGAISTCGGSELAWLALLSMMSFVSRLRSRAQ